jgi:hypothetical protein
MKKLSLPFCIFALSLFLISGSQMQSAQKVVKPKKGVHYAKVGNLLHCMACPENYKSNSGIHGHVAKKHLFCFTCQTCKKNLSSRAHLERHLKMRFCLIKQIEQKNAAAGREEAACGISKVFLPIKFAAINVPAGSEIRDVSPLPSCPINSTTLMIDEVPDLFEGSAYFKYASPSVSCKVLTLAQGRECLQLAEKQSVGNDNNMNDVPLDLRTYCDDSDHESLWT